MARTGRHGTGALCASVRTVEIYYDEVGPVRLLATVLVVAYAAVIGKDVAVPEGVEKSAVESEVKGSEATHDDCKKALLGAKPKDVESTGALSAVAAGCDHANDGITESCDCNGENKAVAFVVEVVDVSVECPVVSSRALSI